MCALQKQTIPFQFSAGLETRQDPKALLAPKLLSLENALFNHPGSLDKRFGLTGVTNRIDATDQALTSGEALATYNNQLIAFDGSKAYSKAAYQDKWIDKGDVVCATNSFTSVIKNTAQQTNCNMATIAGLNCYVWEDSRGGVRYSILDSTTEDVLVNDTLLSVPGLTPFVFGLQASGSTAAQFVIIFRNTNTIQMCRIPTNSIYNVPVVNTLASDLNTSYPVFDACVSRRQISIDATQTNNYSAPVLSEVIYVAYNLIQHIDPVTDYVYEYPYVISVDATATRIPTLIDVAHQGLASSIHQPQLISICPIVDISTLATAAATPTALITWIDTSNALRIGSIQTSTSASLHAADISNAIITPTTNTVTKLTTVWDGNTYNSATDQIGINLFFEQTSGTNSILTSVKLTILLDGTVAVVGSLTDTTAFKTCKRAGLYSKPFVQNGKTYIVISHSSLAESTYAVSINGAPNTATDLQDTYFLVDENFKVVTKINENTAGSNRSGVPTAVVHSSLSFGNTLTSIGVFTQDVKITTPISVNSWQFASLKKGKLISQGNTTFSLTGVDSSTINFSSPYAFYSSELNDNLYVVGGILHNYDGNRFHEAGFNLYPETPILTTGTTAITINQIGDAAHQEIETFTINMPGNRIRSGDYFILFGPSGGDRFNVYFIVDGVDPGPPFVSTGGFPVSVHISSYMSANEVNARLVSVINSLGPFTAVLDGLTPQGIKITANSNGAVTIIVYSTLGVGSIAAGTYQYVACWKWVDNRGYIHRSTTSIPQTIVLANPDNSVTISVPVLDLTDKDNVILEVYRTVNLGTIFHLVTNITSPTYNVRDGIFERQYVSVVDTLADASVLSGELLYTTGGVLDNSPPPACNFITTFKDRLFVTGLDNKNLIQYSKISTPDNHDFAVGFNDALFVELDSKGGDIVALAVMDEKLIVFKQTQIYLMVGDGPTNTGDNATWTTPALISSDTGCDSPNSIRLTPSGLMFKSPKGIYLLDRSLQLTYIGAPVDRYNSLNITSAVLMPTTSEVRFITSDGSAIVYDYLINQWSTFTNYQSNDATLFNNVLYLIRSNGEVYYEDSTTHIDTGLDGYTHYVPMMIESSNLSLANLYGFERVYRLQVLGNMIGPHNLQIDVAYDFNPNFTESTTFSAENVLFNYYGSPAGAAYGSQNTVYGGAFEPYLIEAHLRQQKCTTIRFRITDSASSTATTTAGLSLSGFALQVGVKQGFRKLPANKRLGTG